MQVGLKGVPTTLWKGTGKVGCHDYNKWGGSQNLQLPLIQSGTKAIVPIQYPPALYLLASKRIYVLKLIKKL